MGKQVSRPWYVTILALFLILIGLMIALPSLYLFALVLRERFSGAVFSDFPDISRLAYTFLLIFPALFSCLVGGIALLRGHKLGWYLLVGALFFGSGLAAVFSGEWPIPYVGGPGQLWKLGYYVYYFFYTCLFVLFLMLLRRGARGYCGLDPFPWKRGTIICAALALLSSLLQHWVALQILRLPLAD